MTRLDWVFLVGVWGGMLVGRHLKSWFYIGLAFTVMFIFFAEALK